MCNFFIIWILFIECIIIYIIKIKKKQTHKNFLEFIPNNNSNNDEFKIEIENLKKEINKLKNENDNLKNENKILKNENRNLKKELNIITENLNKKISEFDNLKTSFYSKNNEINNLNNQISGLNINNNPNFGNVNIKDIISILFKSIDQKVEISFPCHVDCIFVRIEEQLYNEYPEYKEFNTYFTVNGRVIKRFKSIKENDLKNFDKILLNVYE